MSLETLFSLRGKGALVTGGYGHLGLAMVEGLAEIGASVLLAGRDHIKGEKAASGLRAMGHDVCFLEMDVADRNSVSIAVSEAAGRFGAIDVLVNNAYYATAGAVSSVSEADWTRGIDGSINTVFRCTQAALPHMPPGSSIINIASMFGVVSPDQAVYGDSGFDNPPSYGAGKAAVIQFTRFCACDFAERGIRVNCISPGPFPSESVQQDRSFIERLVCRSPMRRVGRPEELKGALVFLASAASSYVTGHNLCVDGGWTVW